MNLVLSILNNNTQMKNTTMLIKKKLRGGNLPLTFTRDVPESVLIKL